MADGAGARALCAPREARRRLVAAIALLLASCEDRTPKPARIAASSVVLLPSAPVAPPPAPPVTPQPQRAKGPVLSAPAINDLPRGFSPTFSLPDDWVGYRFDGGTCLVQAHGRLGQAPVRAVVRATGAALTVELELIATSEKVVYRGELANTACAARVSENRGVLQAAKGGGRRYPATLFVSLERTPGVSEISSRMSLTGRIAADTTESLLELSQTERYLLRAYDAFAKPLFLHERSPVDIESVTDDEKGTLVVAYRLPNRELKLAELRRPRRVVRRSIKTGLACAAAVCSSSVDAKRPRPGIVLVFVTNTSWNCGPKCETHEVELWTLTARGFLFSGRVPAIRTSTDPREREMSRSLYWVHVDGGPDLALLFAVHPRPGETSSSLLFTFDAERQRFAPDPRRLEPSPDGDAAPKGSVLFDVW
jgi:hypothetical protein